MKHSSEELSAIYFVLILNAIAVKSVALHYGERQGEGRGIKPALQIKPQSFAFCFVPFLFVC